MSRALFVLADVTVKTGLGRLQLAVEKLIVKHCRGGTAS